MKAKNLISVLTFFIFIFGLANAQDQYILIGWNDLGMHCSNKYFSKVAVLPPYNNIFGQLIKKSTGQLPQIITTGYKIEYSIPGNTYSVGKTDFWTYAQQLFGLPNPLPPNIGLTGKGLTGQLDMMTGYFKADGIPVTPFQDNNWNTESPFQLIHLVARNISTNVILATTDVVIPVSNEVGCVQSGCHASEQSILNNHESVPGFNQNGPVLCASCHGSPALGTVGDTVNAKLFSFRIHDKHKFITPTNSIATCYKCHPGPNTQCLRDVMNTNFSLVCQNCHGTMQNVANTIQAGRRPWIDEPKCGSSGCHGSNFSEEPGKIFKQSKGHAGLFCSSCHGSPHAILPSRVANDNLQNLNLQGHIGTLNNCLVCHSTPPVGAGPHGITYSGIKNINNEVPSGYKLYQNYPNPFNPATKIKFDVRAKGNSENVILKVYNVIGKEIVTLVNEELKSGTYEVSWNAESINSGTYFYKIQIGNYIETKRMVLLK